MQYSKALLESKRISPRITCALALLLAVGVPAAWGQPALPAGAEQFDLSRPLTLAECVEVALALNPSLTAAAGQVRQAEAQVTQAGAPYAPNVRLTWDWFTGESAVSGGAGQAGDTTLVRRSRQDYGVSVTQTFYQSGVAEQRAAARTGVESAEWSQRDTERQVVLGVAQSYYTVLAARQLAEAARRAVQASTQHLDAANARISAGTAPRSDRLPFEVELHQALLAAIATDNQAKTALNGLKQTMGLPPATPLELATQAPQPALPAPEDLAALALEQRPDLRQARTRVENARLNLRVAQIQRGPVVSAGASDSYGRFSDVTGNRWQVQVGVSYPVFDLGSVRAAQQNAWAALEIAEANLTQAELRVTHEVENAQLALVEAQARTETAAAAVAAARLSLEAARERYVVEVGTVLEVTDAEQRLRQAEADEVRARYDYNSAVVALRAALGLADVTDSER